MIRKSTLPIFLGAVIANTTLANPFVSFRIVAAEGQQVLGEPIGVFYDAFSAPNIGPRGDVAFGAFLSGPGLTPSNGGTALFVNSGDSLRIASRSGAPAPGPPPGSYFSIVSHVSSAGTSPIVNSSGDVAFRAGFGPSGGIGFWVDTAAGMGSVAFDGGPVPGLGPGSQFAGMVHSDFTFGDSGHVVFRGGGFGPGFETSASGLYYGRPGEVEPLLLRDDPAPGLGAGVSMHSFSLPLMDAQGQVAFGGTYSAPGNNQGIWSGRPGDLSLVAHEGAAAPGIGAGATFSSTFLLSSMTRSGKIAFSNDYDGTNNPGFGVWTFGPAGLSLMFRDGTPAPGFPSGVTFTAGAPIINDAGHAVFYAALSGPGITPSNSTSVWSLRDEDLTMLARRGEHAPGTEPGVTFISSSGAFNNLAMNERGDVAFLGRLTGADVTIFNDEGIWVTDPSGELGLLVREGGVYEVEPGVFKTLRRFDLDTWADVGSGSSDYLSDSRQLAFQAWFTDNTTAIVVATIPEPVTAAFVLAGIALCRQRALRR